MMPYLVDGNNVMAQRVGWHRDKAGARRTLLDQLANFVRDRRVTISVVFDGAPDQHFADGASYRGVRVFYALRGSDADERIKEIVEAQRDRRTIFVVTSDRALAAYVRQCGAQTVRSGEFRKRLEESATTRPRTERPDVSEKDVPEWMRYFGVDEEDDGDGEK